MKVRPYYHSKNIWVFFFDSGGRRRTTMVRRTEAARIRKVQGQMRTLDRRAARRHRSLS